MTSVNTHDYDGKMKETIQTILCKIKESKNTLEYNACLEEIQRHYSSRSDQSFINIINLLRNDKAGNNDAANNISVEMILPFLWEYIKENKMFDFFYEQLIDIQNGSCAQGRTTRFLQLLSIY
jgi:hypothetical protein